MTCRRVVVSILVDNEAPPGLQTEHGFSLWIEADGLKILFDTGQGEALFPNAETLGVRLGEAAFVVLSHGHYDHGGGIAQVMNVAKEAQLVAHPKALLPRHSLAPGKEARQIGMPESAMAALKRLPAERVLWSWQPLRLSGDIGVTGEIPRESGFEDSGGPFFIDERGEYPDNLPDDQALWIQTTEGLIVFLGCAHAGIINTLRYVMRLTSVNRLRAVIGGFHLRQAKPQRIESTINSLLELNPQQLIPCHCTGEEAIGKLQAAFGAKVINRGSVGRFVFGGSISTDNQP